MTTAANTTVATPHKVSILTSRGLIDYDTVTAVDAADAIRVAHNLSRRPSVRHDGPHGSGYKVGNGWYVASPVGTATTAPAVRCPVCGGTQEVTAMDRVGERGERVMESEAMAVAHYRLAITATSARPFNLHGGRAQ
jgi:hypothetical protein